MKNKFWVTMTDTFLSNWGLANNRINKYVIECDTLEEAQAIKRAALKRNEMKYVNIIENKPKYSHHKYLTSLVKYAELSEIWKNK